MVGYFEWPDSRGNELCAGLWYPSQFFVILKPRLGSHSLIQERSVLVIVDKEELKKVWGCSELRKLFAPKVFFWDEVTVGAKISNVLQTVFWKKIWKNRSHGSRSNFFPTKGPFTPFGRALEEQKASSKKLFERILCSVNFFLSSKFDFLAVFCYFR